MRHRVKDTYPLSHFRQHTREHLDRLQEGRVETITQNGQAAMVVMSPETYDDLQLLVERGPTWDETISRIREERGRDARTVIRELAEEMGVDL